VSGESITHRCVLDDRSFGIVIAALYMESRSPPAIDSDKGIFLFATICVASIRTTVGVSRPTAMYYNKKYTAQLTEGGTRWNA
jgi:hypothetical protein